MDENQNMNNGQQTYGDQQYNNGQQTYGNQQYNNGQQINCLKCFICLLAIF